MAQEHTFLLPQQSGRQFAEPGAMFRTQDLAILLQRSLCGSGSNQLAVLIAADRRQIERNETICSAHRIERAIEVVAQVDDQADAAGANVSKNGVERPNVAVNVCDCGKAEFRHRAVKLAQFNEQSA